MTRAESRSARRIAAAGLAVVLVAAACSGATPVTAPPSRPSGTGSAYAGGPLAAGLGANLDKLASYRFTESNVGTPDAFPPTESPSASASTAAPTGSASTAPSASRSAVSSGSAGPVSASPSMASSPPPEPSASVSAAPSASTPAYQSASFDVSGTVVNAPAASVWVKEPQAQFIVIGSLAWVSVDGQMWMSSDPGSTDLSFLMPASGYATWFDAKASYFTAVGNETKNGVPCVHYKGNGTLKSIYGDTGGASSGFQADVWVAVAGDYPVSGVFGYAGAASGASGGWGFRFDITNVDDTSNQLAAPTNVIAFPT